MAALSALLPIANIEKSQASTKKQDNVLAEKVSQKSSKESENKAASDRENREAAENASEFSLIYQDDLLAYGEAEPQRHAATNSLTVAKDPLQLSSAKGNVLPVEGETLPMSQELADSSEGTIVQATDYSEPSSTEKKQLLAMTTAANEVEGAQFGDKGITGIVLPVADSVVEDNGESALKQQSALSAQDVNATEELAATAKAASLAQSELELAKAQDAESAVLASKSNSPMQQKEQADLVRAWRGATPKEGMNTLAAAGMETLRPMHSSASQGQLQQFAESLRLPQASVEGATLTSERVASTTSTSSPSTETVSAWRHESSPQAPNVQGRNPQGMNFTQVLQAHNFNMRFGHNFGTNQWSESVAQRVSMMAAQNLGSARIELDPPELGAMTVKILLDGDKASVNFMSANAQVRDALEQTFPRLQEMLGLQGLELADAHVSDNPSTGQDSGDRNSGAGDHLGESTDLNAGEESMHSVNVPTGLIDFYA